MRVRDHHIHRPMSIMCVATFGTGFGVWSLELDGHQSVERPLVFVSWRWTWNFNYRFVFFAWLWHSSSPSLDVFKRFRIENDIFAIFGHVSNHFKPGKPGAEASGGLEHFGSWGLAHVLRSGRAVGGEMVLWILAESNWQTFFTLLFVKLCWGTSLSVLTVSYSTFSGNQTN